MSLMSTLGSIWLKFDLNSFHLVVNYNLASFLSYLYVYAKEISFLWILVVLFIVIC